jgi:neutral ceramidase
MRMLRAGVTEIVITPPIGVELQGYGVDLSRRSTDVHDDLMAQALVLDDGQTRIALITVDLMGVSAEFTQSVRRQIEAETGIPAANVMLACSHSHTAAGTLPNRGIGKVEASYARILVRYLAGAVAAAAGKLEPVRLSVGRGEHPALAWNRLGRDIVDPSVGVACLERESGGTLALLAHYACHPVMLGPKSEISADYPWALRQYLKDNHPGSMVLFMNGTCGDIDPVSNRAVWGKATFEDVMQAGAALGKDAEKTLTKAATIKNPHIKTQQTLLALHYNISPLDDIRAKIADYDARARGKSASAELKLIRHWRDYFRDMEKRLLAGKLPEREDAELQVISVGDSLALLAIPAEVFTAQGLALRGGSGFTHTWPVCYANGLYGYFSPREDFDVDGYGAKTAPSFFDRPVFRSDIADSLVEAATPLLKL